MVAEAGKPDFLDVDKDGDKKEPMKKAAKDAKKAPMKKDAKKDAPKGKKEMSDKQKKFFGKKNESIKTAKKTVAESVEVIKDPSNLTYKEMIKLVQESGGQQQIDPVDDVLWTWAQRVAASKVEESNKAEIFAGLIYERNGGTFKMFDVLAEDK